MSPQWRGISTLLQPPLPQLKFRQLQSRITLAPRGTASMLPPIRRTADGLDGPPRQSEQRWISAMRR